MKSQIFKTAWQFFKQTGLVFSECLKKAWANFKLKEAMQTKVVEFYYKKGDVAAGLGVPMGQAKEDLDKGKISEDRFVEISIKIDKQEAEKQTDLFLEELQNSDKWNDAFDNIERITTERLKSLRELLVQQLEQTKSEVEQKKIKIHIEGIDKELFGRSGITQYFNVFKQSVGEYIQSKKVVKRAQDEYNSAIARFGEYSKEAIAKQNALTNAESYGRSMEERVKIIK